MWLFPLMTFRFDKKTILGLAALLTVQSKFLSKHMKSGN